MDNNKDDRNLNYINTPIQFKENKILPKSLQKTEASRESHRKLQIPPDFPSYTISTRPLSAWDEFLNLYLRPSVIKKNVLFFFKQPLYYMYVKQIKQHCNKRYGHSK